MSDSQSEAPEASPALPYFATCPRGVEPLLLEELRGFGAASVKETVGGIHATGDLAFAYKACLWSRLASRILMPLQRFALTGGSGPHAGSEALYAAAHAIDWPELFDARYSFAIEVAGRSQVVTHSHYAALKVKDAVADRFRAAVGKRPDVDAEAPDIRIHLHLDGEHATLSLDLAGESLHQRGYRHRGVTAPLKENLAAALLLRAGWPAIAARGGGLLDPMCGSGTLVIEAGWIAADTAPGLLRERWGFSAWNEHQPKLWRTLREQAETRRERGLKGALPPLVGRDLDPAAISAARTNGQRAGLTGKVDFTVGDATAALPPAGEPGLVICNPPYGERLANEAELVKLHSLYGSRLKSEFGGWKAALFTGRPDLGHRLGLRADKMYSFFNGALPCKLLLIDVHAANVLAPRPEPVEVGSAAHEESPAFSAAPAVPPAAKGERKEVAPDFANRLRKNLSHLNKWAKRSGVSNYRLYDADLKDYAVAVDLYNTPERHAVVQEYAPPKTIEPAAAERRLREALTVIQQVLELPSANLHYKLRRAQKGPSQYQRQADTERYHVATEHGAKLWVNFDDYLDTGVFLDHRPMRLRLQKEAAGKRLLNLFCYTGAATVQAAVGGAVQTLSVDLSNTYLDWLAQNLELNQFSCEEVDGRGALPSRLPPHATLRADCLEWLARTAADPRAPKFDLIFCDPPTFSNSKKMEDSWDVQRDHAALIADAMRLLAPGGVLYFSCNRQRFKLDALEEYEVRDISPQTLDEDFKRPPPAHRCWRITARV
ncbi:MAG: bifunctional 23S rRNA (guanine(2069)-N(7))-methyltransferase RlmK/23S rRNA (guanine(2445)-N(2))-methyltransferase RlmL [Stagnimonas sp.]|nr:bifunctional 23S rRNA (guanine(2069)-N(7))-methyltransferase RlmK/23S rRNA (guanine(2445)-N(2))-methyltransferase RlmL [Stagnimonas sp.]